MRITHSFIMILLLVTSTIIFAETGSTSSTSITNTITSPTSNSDKAVQSTTYTTTTSTTRNSKDDDIVSAIYAKYARASALIGTAITVTSENGIVTINGTVTAQSQADEAVIAAKSVHGVKDVRSNITVTTNPNPYKAPQKPNY